MRTRFGWPGRPAAIALLAMAWPALAAPPAAPLRDVAEVAVGRAHSCVLDTAGAVACWGDNAIGQLGVGDSSRVTARTTAVPVPALGSGNRSLAAGDYHTCVVTAGRSVRCWGLGIGTGSGSEQYEIPEPVAVLGLGGPVEALSAGAEHTCARLTDGRVQCWGGNERGQLGDGSTTQRLQAVDVTGLGAAALIIEAGGFHSCAALANGETRCWGNNEFGQIGDDSQSDRSQPTPVQGLPSAVRSISAGALATCAATESGALFCWGSQFPLAAFDGGSLRARAYPGFESGYRQVDGGAFHFCALREDRRVKCLGDNVDGQLGTGPIDDSAGAEFVIGLDPDIDRIASGGWHSCARAESGGLQCWGRNAEGQLGIDATNLRLVPTPVSGLGSGQARVAAGGFHSCGLAVDGSVRCWGFNGSGQLGDGSVLFRPTPTAVLDLAPGTHALEAGDSHNCVISADRKVKCWGANFDGRLGNGQTLDSPVPVDVVGLDGEAIGIALGREHGCALLAGGAVRCWGRNEFGQLGRGDTQDSLTAIPVQGLASGASAIAAGYYHTCAVVEGGLRCWGLNGSGQLGDGSRNNRLAPVAVANPGGTVLAVDAGIVHTCALLQGGSVSCWGFADFGTLLGDGSTEDRLVPAPVPSLREGVVQIALGGFHSCVRTTAGGMQCWGSGGAIGDNSLNHRPTPVAVAGLERGVQHISAGFGGQTCAVVNGAARCWGENSFAQIGDGSTHGEPFAQRVLSNAIVRRVGPVLPEANAVSTVPQLAGEGRFLVFQSEASNLVEGDSNGFADVFVLDRELNLIRRVSVDNGGAQLAGPSTEPTVSADGRLVAFVAPAAAPARLLGESKRAREARRKGSGNAVFLRNLLTGSTQQIGSALPMGGSTPQLAAGGEAVVFTGLPADSSQGTGDQPNVFFVALAGDGDEVTPGPPQCVSCKPVGADGSVAAGNADGASGHPVVSADAQWVAYETQASNSLVGSPSPCAGGSSQVILRNLTTGSSQRISPPPALPAAACGSSGSRKPSIDHGGKVIAFQSDQALAAADGNDRDDVYVWRDGQAELVRVSLAGDGGEPSAAAGSPKVSGDGKQVIFVTAAPNLDLSFADNNDSVDVHAVALADPTNALRLSRTPTGAEADGDAEAPALNFDGSEIAFASTAGNFASTVGSHAHVFTRSNPLSPLALTATWWVPTESGWGLSVFQQGGLLAPAWFTYDVDGEPTWFLVSGAFPQADGSFRGELFRLTGTPFDQIQGPAVRTVSSVGEVVLRYVGEDELRFDYRVGDVQQGKVLRRFPFGAREFACAASPGSGRADASNFTDLWTGAAGSDGWGLTLFHIDALLVAAWYTYDADGEAVFFVLSTSRQPDGSFAGGVFRQSDGVPFPAIDGAPPSPGTDPIGEARLRFLDGERGEFSYRIGAIEQTRPIERLLVGDQATVCRSVDAGAR